MAKQIGTKKWQKTQNATAAAWSPYKPWKEQVCAAVATDGRPIVGASWIALRGIVRATVGTTAPKWGGMDDTALGKRIGAKNLAWAHVADVWGTALNGTAFMLDRNDPHYAAVRASALAFRAAVTGQIGTAWDTSGTAFNANPTAQKIGAALLLACAEA